MKKSILNIPLNLALIFVSLFFVNAQNVNAQSYLEDVVYLKDGSILRGFIVEMDENQSLKIEIEGGSQFFILFEEVQEITKEPRYKESFYKDQGYVNHTGIDRLPGKTGSSTRYQMTHGYQFNPYFSLGLGIAYVSYNEPLNTVPVFLDAKMKLLKANTTPFTFIKLGYSFTSEGDNENWPPIEEHNGGLMYNIGGGLIFETRAGYGWYINLGYSFEKMSFQEENLWWNQQTIDNDITYKRVNFGIGLTF